MAADLSLRSSSIQWWKYASIRLILIEYGSPLVIEVQFSSYKYALIRLILIEYGSPLVIEVQFSSSISKW